MPPLTEHISLTAVFSAIVPVHFGIPPRFYSAPIRTKMTAGIFIRRIASILFFWPFSSRWDRNRERFLTESQQRPCGLCWSAFAIHQVCFIQILFGLELMTTDGVNCVQIRVGRSATPPRGTFWVYPYFVRSAWETWVQKLPAPSSAQRSAARSPSSPGAGTRWRGWDKCSAPDTAGSSAGVDGAPSPTCRSWSGRKTAPKKKGEFQSFLNKHSRSGLDSWQVYSKPRPACMKVTGTEIKTKQ